jgi:hypothetical protein
MLIQKERLALFPENIKKLEAGMRVELTLGNLQESFLTTRTPGLTNKLLKAYSFMNRLFCYKLIIN